MYTYTTDVRINPFVPAGVAARGNGTCCKSSLSSSLTTKMHKVACFCMQVLLHSSHNITHPPTRVFWGTTHNILYKKRHSCRNDAVFTTIHKVIMACYETCILSARENLFLTRSPLFTFAENYFSRYV